MTKSISLKKAQRIILSNVRPMQEEKVDLPESLGRIAAKPIRATESIPAFPRAAMDGFVVNTKDILEASPESQVKLPIVDEIPAGRVHFPRLKNGQTMRIMTGAAVPKGGDQIIPLEACKERKNSVFIKKPGFAGKHIRKTGSELRKGTTIVGQGQPVTIEHLALLAECGQHTLNVYKKPSLAFLSTGSELLEINSKMQTGKIVSGNRFILEGLTRQSDAEPIDLGLAKDTVDEIVQAISSSHDAQIIVTTGGMGPGKFDLMKEVYTEMGVNIIYDSINVRPGRATMFGIMGNTLFFALPGPPPAARLLFQELVRPALLAAQGVTKPIPTPLRAYLEESISLKKSGKENLKGGVFSFRRESIVVRPARKTEPINCIILIPSNRRSLLIGEKVKLHPLA